MTERTHPGPNGRNGDQLTAWLMSLVRNREYGKLAELRRTKPTDSHIRAGWYAPEEHREVYEKVAFLFGVYHQGATVPLRGKGSLGDAARRIGDGSGRGPENPGAQRLMSRVVASRRLPWRHLQHTITRLRACEQPPPSWSQLTADLTRWHDRKARIPYLWTVHFHEPSARSRGATAGRNVIQSDSGTNEQLTRKDAST
ncbi:type I-E CRISPR-associated protein Cse2/CasB [Streptomyces microflavus]|jgi:CRISPR system Cascade subunit CasA|uniref:type I-E CRISPR-associated protein Cse2/CasB n=1 Tax=Streptomyces TaxID=1883 RepID=UPI000823AAD4|nr:MULTISPECIES: type I-E CRISPR-associated protein Cse2/CasB [Streptomyces]SCK17739.1 CRISPR-associated protein Cse2 (CRISPR_cse2) [Streptomyces sp. ScaeMP-e48]